jgi:hypothetical protein
VHTFPLGAEDTQHLGRLLARAAEPVRHLGPELGNLARPEHEIVVSQNDDLLVRLGCEMNERAAPTGPPSKHQLGLVIWIAVFPTLTLLNRGARQA